MTSQFCGQKLKKVGGETNHSCFLETVWVYIFVFWWSSEVLPFILLPLWRLSISPKSQKSRPSLFIPFMAFIKYFTSSFTQPQLWHPQSKYFTALPQRILLLPSHFMRAMERAARRYLLVFSYAFHSGIQAEVPTCTQGNLFSWHQVKIRGNNNHKKIHKITAWACLRMYTQCLRVDLVTNKSHIS